MKLQRKLSADNWSLSADTKLLLMRTTAGDLFSTLPQDTHRYAHMPSLTHTGEENISEHKGQTWTETSRGRQEVNIKQWNKSTLALFWKVRSPRVTRIIPIFIHWWKIRSSSTLWTGFGSNQVCSSKAKLILNRCKFFKMSARSDININSGAFPQRNVFGSSFICLSSFYISWLSFFTRWDGHRCTNSHLYPSTASPQHAAEKPLRRLSEDITRLSEPAERNRR